MTTFYFCNASEDTIEKNANGKIRILDECNDYKHHTRFQKIKENNDGMDYVLKNGVEELVHPYCWNEISDPRNQKRATR